MSARDKDRKARERDAKKAGGDKRRTPGGSPGRGGRAPKPCRKCDGSGTVTKWITPRVGAKFKIDNTCPDCHGRGETT